MTITILNSILILCLSVYIYKNFYNLNNIMLIAFSMITGGGISNLIDRIVKGNVIDYIDINYFFKYPIFNLADVFIVVGVFFIIGNLIYKSNRTGDKQKIGNI